jgi:hypothetical protein
MDNGWQPPCSRNEYSTLLAEVESVIDVTRRLPHLPFRASCGPVDVCEFDRLLAGSFADVLCALMDAHGDDSIVLVALDPDPFSYCERKFPAFRIARGDLMDGYWAQLNYELAGDTSGSIRDVSDTVALVGSTHTWSAYGQSDWDLTLVHSQAAQRPWLDDDDAPFVSAREALEWFTELFVPRSDAERSIFLGSMDAMAERPCE